MLTDQTFLRINRPGLWLDSLHLQIVAGSSLSPHLVSVLYDGAAFITNSVFQGDAIAKARGLVSVGSVMGAYVKGVHDASSNTTNLAGLFLRCPVTHWGVQELTDKTNLLRVFL